MRLVEALEPHRGVRLTDGRIRWRDVRAYREWEHTAGRPVKQIEFNGEPFTKDTLLALRKKCLNT